MKPLAFLFLLASALLHTEALAASPDREPGSVQKPVPSGDTYYHTLLAMQYEREGKSEEALAEYERALAEDQPLRRRLVVCQEPVWRRQGDVEIYPLVTFLEELWSHQIVL